jgi:hypothetical protein
MDVVQPTVFFIDSQFSLIFFVMKVWIKFKEIRKHNLFRVSAAHWEGVSYNSVLRFTLYALRKL